MSKIAGENMDKATKLFAKMINAKKMKYLLVVEHQLIFMFYQML